MAVREPVPRLAMGEAAGLGDEARQSPFPLDEVKAVRSARRPYTELAVEYEDGERVLDGVCQLDGECKLDPHGGARMMFGGKDSHDLLGGGSGDILPVGGAGRGDVQVPVGDVHSAVSGEGKHSLVEETRVHLPGEVLEREEMLRFV